MAADAHAPLAVEPPFALPGSPRVLKDRLAAVRRAVPENDVRDQLFEGRVLLHFLPRLVADVRRTE